MEYDFSLIIPLLPAIGASVTILIALIGIKITSIEKGLKEDYGKSKEYDIKVEQEVDSFFEKIRRKSNNPTYPELVNMVSKITAVKEIQSNIEEMMDNIKNEVRNDLLMLLLLVVPIPIAIIYLGGDIPLWYLIIGVLLSLRVVSFWDRYKEYSDIGKQLTLGVINQKDNILNRKA